MSGNHIRIEAHQRGLLRGGGSRRVDRAAGVGRVGGLGEENGEKDIRISLEGTWTENGSRNEPNDPSSSAFRMSRISSR